MHRFLDLSVSGQEKKDLMNAIESILDSGVLVMGPVVETFEREIARISNRKFAVGVGSGTDALFTGLRALDLQPQDEIITTSLSWIATANAIKMAGAKPVFADIDDDLNICCDSIARLINSRTKAILVVNFNGLMANMENLLQLCHENGLVLIEDAAQSFGAVYKGRPAGSFGLFSAMSHNPMKILGGLGECGSILTDNEELKSKIEIMRYNGTVDRQTCVIPSLNSRLDSLQASVLLARINYAYSEIESRRKNASIYNSLIGDLVTVPIASKQENHVYYTYTIRTPHRDELKSYLEDQGVETKIMHPQPMPCHPAYSGSSGEWENALSCCSEILSLPIASHIDEIAVRKISKLVESFFNHV